MIKVMILGGSGMLGHAMVKHFSKYPNKYDVVTITRKLPLVRELGARFIVGLDVLNSDALEAVFKKENPSVVLNCIGLIKQRTTSDDPNFVLLNSYLPNLISKFSRKYSFRLIHFSTDCVFSGKKGNYVESDAVDPLDLYGRSKYAGEVAGDNILTVRTSIIGHEQATSFGLVEWFLSDLTPANGYSNAIYSGLPTCELAVIVEKYLISRTDINGILHVSSEPISKFNLLKLISDIYSHYRILSKDSSIKIDRSLDSSLMQKLTGYKAPSWNILVSDMCKDRGSTT